MEKSNNQKIKIEDIQNILGLEDTLIELNRLSHFIEHNNITRHDIFKKSIIINFNSYFLENKNSVDNYVNRLKAKIKLLNGIEYEIENSSTLSYIKKIWEDIYAILELIEEQIDKSVKRIKGGVNTNFIIDADDYEKTEFIREIEKLRQSEPNSWLTDEDFSHGLT